MKKIWKRVCTGILALTTILTALPTTSVHAAETQYWTESSERVGYIEHVMNDGTIHSTFNEGHMRVEGETAYCVDINTGFKNGYKIRHDASASMSAAQIEDVALSLEYVKQYRGSHSNLNANQGYLLEQCVVWQRLSEQLGWKCDNVRAAYSEISQDIQNEVYAEAILLDEPTSNLDSLNEGIILKSLKESAKKKTVVLVSHRVSTMNVADVVYEMENGRIS